MGQGKVALQNWANISEKPPHIFFRFNFCRLHSTLPPTEGPKMSVPKQVLIIDDDASYRQMLGEILELHGWKVLDAGEGERGIELARQHRPEIVLCDLLMPRGNGFL